MTKTIRQWLETLPEPYRTQALRNAEPVQLQKEAYDLGHAIIDSCTWNDTPEKGEYWADVAYWAKEGRGQLPTPMLNTTPVNALSALHAIALKKCIKVEEISWVWREDGYEGQWAYTLVSSDEKTHYFINLKND